MRGKRYRVSAKVKVTGDAASECRTALYVSRYQNAENSTGWANVATIGDRYGNRDEWISGVVSTDNIPEDYGYFGIYFRIGVRAYGGKITNAVVEISEITLLPMADGELIVDGAVTAAKIAAGAVTAEKVVAGAINTDKIAANAITSAKVAAGAITAEKIKVNNLSALSANLGTVTAGTIKGTTITGNTISGGTISGAEIHGGVIRGTHFEGATGTFTGALSVTQLIGGGIIEHTLGELRNTGETALESYLSTPQRNSWSDTDIT